MTDSDVDAEKDNHSVKYTKQTESDKQMFVRIGIKFVVLFVLIFLFDSLLDLLSGLIDMVLELFHLMIEAVEYSIELLLEHIFQSNHQQSEMIIVNLAIIIFLYAFYRFCLVLPRLYRWLKNKLKSACVKRQHREAECWHALSLNRKIKVLLAYLVGISCLLFFLTI